MLYSARYKLGSSYETKNQELDSELGKAFPMFVSHCILE